MTLSESQCQNCCLKDGKLIYCVLSPQIGMCIMTQHCGFSAYRHVFIVALILYCILETSYNYMFLAII